MLVGNFTSLWNRAVFGVGLGWLVLVFLIWQSGQLETSADRAVFAAVLVAGFLVTYIFGFILEARYNKKKLS